MSIADTLIRQILSSSLPPRHAADLADDKIPEEDLVPLGLFDDSPDLEVFLDREPDTGEEFPQHPESLSLLGYYRPMSSPGLLTLCRGNIEAYWKSLIRQGQRHYPFITLKDSERVLQLLVYSVYQHERFHYVCDFSRRLVQGPISRLHEEALAVAWEWQWLRSQDRWNNFYGLINPTLRRIVVQAMFNHRSPGYRDWRQFAAKTVFYDAVTAYLHPAAQQTFNGTSFNFGAWAVTHVPDDSNRAWEERIGP